MALTDDQAAAVSDLTNHFVDIAAKYAKLQEAYRAIVLERDTLRSKIKDMQELIEQSDGIAGYHRNGDIAEWTEFPWLA